MGKMRQKIDIKGFFINLIKFYPWKKKLRVSSPNGSSNTICFLFCRMKKECVEIYKAVTRKSSMAASLPRCSVQVDIFTSLETP